MSVSDFLFEGKPPKSVTEYGSTVSTIPKWLSDYNQGVISKANSIAGADYDPYGGPRIAGFTPDQVGAQEAVRSNQGNYQPYFDQRGDTVNQVAGNKAMDAANPYFDEARGKYGEGQGGLDQAQAMVNQSTGTYVDNVDSYMSPYVQNVLDRQESLANRTLNESFIPGLQASFVGSGQFGSGKMMEQGLRGVRDISEGLEDQRLATLDNAYKTGADIFSTDQNRTLDAARTTSDIGVRTSDIGQNLADIGKTSADIVNADNTTALSAADQMGSLGEATQTAGLKDAAALDTVGTNIQGMDQQSLDLAYQDYLQQRDYPKSQINWMNDLVKGMATDEVARTSQTGPAAVYQPSGLSQAASTVSTLKGLGDLLQGEKDGGRIRYKRGGLAQATRRI